MTDLENTQPGRSRVMQRLLVVEAQARKLHARVIVLERLTLFCVVVAGAVLVITWLMR